MADNPYWTPSELDLSEDGSSERDSSDDLVDIDKYDKMALQAAIQQSYKESKENNKGKNKMTKKETNKVDKPTTLPERKLTAQQIEEGERWRERELYGPPTPPRRPRQIDAMKSSHEPSATTVGTASRTNDAQPRTSAAKHPQKSAATVDRPKVDPGSIAGYSVAASKRPFEVHSAVADAVAYHRQISSDPLVANAGPTAGAPSSRSKYEVSTISSRGGSPPPRPFGSSALTPPFEQSVMGVLEGNIKSDKTVVPEGMPMPPCMAPAPDCLLYNYADQGFDTTWLLDVPEVTWPYHKHRTTVIPDDLDDTFLRLTFLVQEDIRARRDEKRQRSQGGSSAGPQPGSERAGTSQTKTRHGQDSNL